MLLLLACTPQPKPEGPPQGVLVLAGGGSEGEVGDNSAWSARLYRELLASGDVSGDGKVSVVVLATEPEDEWLPDYFRCLGADQAENHSVPSRVEADAPEWDAVFEEADAVFLKGGDQGDYYDLWNETRIESGIRSVMARGGGVGGTSAGAMSLADYALAGGQDLISLDVLQDSHTSYLKDTDGGSGIHHDFLGFVPHAVVDTHFTTRARLGRLAGTLAKAAEDFGDPELWGIGLEEQTGIVIRNGEATVIGVGAVSLLRPDSAPVRIPGEPLRWDSLDFDRLTDGWSFALGKAPTEMPAEAEAVTAGEAPIFEEGEWYADGDYPAHEERFGWVAERPSFAVHPGTDAPRLLGTFGLLDAHNSDRRSLNEESLFRGIYDHAGATGFLVPYGSSLEREGEGLVAVTNPETPREDPAAVLVISTEQVRYRSLSPEPSLSDPGDGSLHAAGLVGMQLMVLWSEGAQGNRWERTP